MDLKVAKVTTFGENTVWGISGYTDNELRRQLIDLIKAYPKNKFKIGKSEYGEYYSIEQSSKAGRELFNSKAVQELAYNVTSTKSIELLSKLFIRSRSNFLNLDFLETISNLSPKDYKEFISGFKHSKNKLLPLELVDSLNVFGGENKLHSAWLYSSKEESEKIRFREFAAQSLIKHKAIPFVPNMDIASRESGNDLPPHTDTLRKIATLLIYLPTTEEQRNSYLGTTFWKPLTNYNMYSSNSLHLQGEQRENFKKKYKPIRTKFQDEYAILFFRSDTSWHSFKYDIENIGSRIAISINFKWP